MWPAMVIKMNPVTNHSTGMLQGFKSLPMHTLLLQRSNDTLHYSILLRAMERDELLLQCIASDQDGVASASKNKSIVRPQQK